jgi:hypothetical protein
MGHAPDSRLAVAVENDYNLLVSTLNDLAEELVRLKTEIEKHLLDV